MSIQNNLIFNIFSSFGPWDLSQWGHAAKLVCFKSPSIFLYVDMLPTGYIHKFICSHLPLKFET